MPPISSSPLAARMAISDTLEAVVRLFLYQWPWLCRVMQSCTWKTSVCFENSIAEKAIYLKPSSSFIEAEFRIQCPEFLGELRKAWRRLLFAPLWYWERTTESVFLSWGAALKSPLFFIFLMSNCLNWSHTAQYRSNLFLMYLNVCNKSVATVQLKCHFCSF